MNLSISNSFRPRPLVKALVLSGALASFASPGLVVGVLAQTAFEQMQEANISAGELSRALMQWSDITGWNLSVDAGLLKGKISDGLTGHYSPEQGFKALLRNSGLFAEFDDGQVTVLKTTLEVSNSISPIIVTSATKTEKAIEGVIASIEVITKQDIEKTGATTLRGVLLKQPSLNLQYARFPHPSSVSKASLSIRGAGANGTLILVDGKRLPGETEGPYEIDRIPVDMIERIEVVKGSMSTLYGSDAMGGVINIITKSVNDPLTSVTVQYGQNMGGAAQEKSLSFNHMNKKGKLAYGVYGTLNRALPYKVEQSYTQVAKDPSTHAVETVGGISGVTGQEDATYRDQSQVNALGARLSYEISTQTQIGLDLGWTDEHREGHYVGAHRFPNAGDPVMVNGTPVQSIDDNNRRDASLDITHNFGEVSLLKARAYTSSYEKRNVTSSKNFTAPDNKKFSADVRIDAVEATVNLFSLENQVLTLGADYRKETRDSSAINPNPQSTDFITKVVEYKSAFIQDEIEFSDGWSANLGARYDDISNAEEKTTIKLGVLKALNELTRVRVNYSQGYRAPDIAELYVVAPYFKDARRFGSDVIFGPKQTAYDLKPETSETFEAAIHFGAEGFNGELVTFRSVIKNKIELVAKNDGASNKYYTSENLDEVVIDGVEFSGNYRFNKKLDFSYDAVWLRPINEATNKNLAFTPEISASFGMDYLIFDALTTNLTGRYIGDQFVDDANQKKLAGYELFGMSLNYRLDRKTRIYAGVNNLADQNVDLKAGGNVGRYFYLGANYNF